TQGLMLNATNAEGTALAYPAFLETVQSIRPLMLGRALGGSFYLLGWILLIFNIFQTIKGAEPVNGTVTVYARDHVATAAAEGSLGAFGTIFNAPFLYAAAVVVGSCLWMLGTDLLSLFGLFITIVATISA